MELTIDFRTIVAAISWSALAIVLLSLLLVVRASYLRRAALHRESELQRLRAQWEPVLGGPPQHLEKLPAIARADELEWMLMWNQAQDAARTQDDAPARQEYLNDLASRKGMRARALLWTHRHDVVDRLAAVTMLGHLRETAASSILRSLCDSSNTLISIAAAHALLQVDLPFATRFVELMTARSDWAPGKLAAIVRSERDALTAPLLDFCRTAPVPVVRPVVPYLRYLPAAKVLPVLQRLLDTPADPQTSAAALKVLGAIGGPADAAPAVKLAAHEDWRVRVQAANVLGALGSNAHIPLLTTMLDDSHWWVRYRAARALAELADRCKTDLAAILRERTDPFARDVLTQVISERAPLLQGVAAS